MLPWSDWVVPSAWDPGTKVKIPYTLHCPVSTPARCREHGTYGGQGKAVGCVPPTALLFEGAPIGLCWHCWRNRRTPIKSPSAAAFKSKLLIFALAASSRHRNAKRPASYSRSERATSLTCSNCH